MNVDHILTITNDFKAAEELRRERHWDPKIRWLLIQETMAWADAQHTARRNTKESRLREQDKKLEWIRLVQHGTDAGRRCDD